MTKLNFHQPLRQSSVSHDPSEIIPICLFAAQKTLLVMLQTVVLLNIFVKIVIIFFFQIYKLIPMLRRRFSATLKKIKNPRLRD